MNDDRRLLYTLGALHFAWRITSDQIEVYSMVEGKVDRRLGMLTVTGADGEVVEFEQGAFELHCQWFAMMASDAEVREEPEQWDGVDDHDRRLGEALADAGFPQETVDRARKGHWSDFKSPLPGPKLELVAMLNRHGEQGNQAALDLVPRVIQGEFDG